MYRSATFSTINPDLVSSGKHKTMNKFGGLFLINLSILISCTEQKENPDFGNTDTLIFGHFYGFCIGEQCIEIYKLTEENLYEDTLDTYPRWDEFYEGDYVKLDREKFESVRTLWNEIPSELLAAEDTVFGLPDAADGGGIYFEMRQGEFHRFWVIDQVDENIPEYLKIFRGRINEYINQIND
jgi:hypothetical protein